MQLRCNQKAQESDARKRERRPDNVLRGQMALHHAQRLQLPLDPAAAAILCAQRRRTGGMRHDGSVPDSKDIVRGLQGRYRVAAGEDESSEAGGFERIGILRPPGQINMCAPA